MGTAATRAEVAKAYTGGAIGNADAENTVDLKKARFGVFAYSTGADDYVPGTPTALLPNFMYNQELIYGSATTNEWVYSPVKYWPNGIDAANPDNAPSSTAREKTAGKLSFFAVAPFTTTPTETYTAASDGKKPTAIGSEATNDGKVKKNNASKGINAMTTNDWTGNVWVKYLMPNASEKDAVDLLWGLRGSASYSETDNSPSTGDVGTVYNINLTKQTVDEKVSFFFKHALAKIGGTKANGSESTTGNPAKCGFKVVVDVDANGNIAAGRDNQSAYFGSDFSNSQTLVTLKSVKLRDLGTVVTNNDVPGITSGTSNLITSGWFNIETGSWCNDAGTYTTGASYSLEANSTNSDTGDNTYTLNEKIKEATSYGKSGSSETKKMASGDTAWDSNNPTGVTTTAQDIFCNENVPGLMFIPIPGQSADLYVTVDYVVRTVDKNLNTGFTQVEQIITNKVNLSGLAPNKSYTIIMHLGLTSVKFEAVVSDWETTANADFNEDGTNDGGGDPNAAPVWLPSNVVAYKANQVEAGTATSASISISGYNIGNYVSNTVDTDADIKDNGVSGNGTTVTVNFDAANNTSKDKVNVITIVGELGKVTVTLTHKAGALVITPSYDPALAGDNIPNTGTTITLDINDASGADLDLTDDSNTSTINASVGTVTKTATGATIAIPENTTGSDRTITYSVKVNDADVQEFSITQAGE